MPWVCGGCRSAIEEEAQACTVCGLARPGPGAAGGAPATRILAMEAHLRAVGIWFRIGGALLAGGGVLLWLMVRDEMTRSGWELVLGGMILLGILLAVLGRLLSNYSRVGRILSAVVAALAMIGLVLRIAAMFSSVGVGLAVTQLPWTAAVLWVLLNRRAVMICTPAYRTLVAGTPADRPRTLRSPFFWIPLPFFWIPLVLTVLEVLNHLGAVSLH